MERRVSPYFPQFCPCHAKVGDSFGDDYEWVADKSDCQWGVAVPDDDATLSSSGDGPIDATSFLFKYLNNNPRDYKMGCQSLTPSVVSVGVHPYGLLQLLDVGVFPVD